nr:unnamed protein product [Callosobruchus analis]
MVAHYHCQRKADRSSTSECTF